MLLSIDHLRVAYGHVEAVRGVSLELETGEFVGIIGPNGAGKSTTLTAIAGITPMTGGVVSVEGQSIAGKRADEIVRLGVSLVPEGRQTFTRLTAEENLSLAARTAGAVHGGAMREIYERFPALERLRRTPAGRLSGGEQQQLVIARALLTRPKLLMLDEPSLGLAPRLVEEVFDLLLQLKRDGITILLVEQNAAETVEIADRTLIMSKGELTPFHRGEDVHVDQQLLAAYLGVKPLQ
jgi:branched-chain amino acid transport system ATP-binding protein